MVRRITRIASCGTRNSTSLDLLKKALYWQKMKDLEISTTFDKDGTLLEKSSECLNQEGSGKNLAFFLKNLTKSAITENTENPIIKSPVPTK